MSDSLPHNVNEDECPHPFNEVVSKGLQVVLTDNPTILLAEEQAKACKKCGDVLETAGKSDGILVRPIQHDCPHPIHSVEQKTVDLVLVDSESERTISNRTLEFCKACQNVVEETRFTIKS
jgi:hypothetical protein